MLNSGHPMPTSPMPARCLPVRFVPLLAAFLPCRPAAALLIACLLPSSTLHAAPSDCRPSAPGTCGSTSQSPDICFPYDASSPVVRWSLEVLRQAFELEATPTPCQYHELGGGQLVADLSAGLPPYEAALRFVNSRPKREAVAREYMHRLFEIRLSPDNARLLLGKRYLAATRCEMLFRIVSSSVYTEQFAGNYPQLVNETVARLTPGADNAEEVQHLLEHLPLGSTGAEYVELARRICRLPKMQLAEIGNFYRRYLNRSMRPYDKGVWLVPLLKDELTLESIEAMIISSAECFQQLGGSS